MERNMIEVVNKFFASVYEYIDRVAVSCVHPKKLKEVNKAKTQMEKLQKLIVMAFNSKDMSEVYKLVNLRHHPDYQVPNGVFFLPYSDQRNTDVYSSFNDVINKVCDYVYYGGSDKEKAVLSAMKNWYDKQSGQPKFKEYDFIPVVKKFFDDVFVLANKNAAKYNMPQSKAECADSMSKLLFIRQKIESITTMENPEWQVVERVGGDAINTCLCLSNKLFADPKHQNNREVFYAFENVLKGIKTYYKEDMKRPDLILSQIKNWYRATSDNMIDKIRYSIRSAAKFAKMENQK